MSLQIRKPIVEKKRRARINESLQELRGLLADTDVSSALSLYFPLYSIRKLKCLNVTVPRQDGERRGAGAYGEKGGRHPEEQKPRWVQFGIFTEKTILLQHHLVGLLLHK